jgi:cellobiose epimerase
LGAMARRFPDDPRHYQKLFSKQWEYIKGELIDPRRGGWYPAGLDAGGEETGPKSSEWKAGYHDGRALINASE